MKANHWILKDLKKRSRALVINGNSIFIKFSDGMEIPFIVWTGASAQLMISIEEKNGNDFVVDLREIESFDDVYTIIPLLVRQHKKKYSSFK